MTEKEFRRICSLQGGSRPIAIRHGEYDIQGKLVGCTENSFVIECNGQSVLWPYILCDSDQSTYPTPSYS